MDNNTATKLIYATETCGRCGGTGHYSYNSMHGTICYGCAGRKTRMTKSGAKASKAVKAFIEENFSVPVEALQPGDVVKVEGKTCTVATVTTEGGGRYGSKDANGEMVWHNYVTLTFVKPIHTAFGVVSSHGFCPGTKVVKSVSGANWDAVVAFARTIKKGVSVVQVAK